jgi:GDPmannose 4,6-dehydratase
VFDQASTSELYGEVQEIPQTETTPFYPRSPYGVAKLYAYWITRNYRQSYGIYAGNGILFNHESPRRGSNFVTNKVVKAAVKIKLGLEDKLELGNMNAYRDWGHSKDYVRAMNMIINHKEPDDFVVSTGVTHSVREMCNYVFSLLDLDYKSFITQNPKFLRAEELKYLKGDSSKIRKVLGWKPEYTFDVMMEEMADHWMGVYSGK